MTVLRGIEGSPGRLQRQREGPWARTKLQIKGRREEDGPLGLTPLKRLFSYVRRAHHVAQAGFKFVGSSHALASASGVAGPQAGAERGWS